MMIGLRWVLREGKGREGQKSLNLIYHNIFFQKGFFILKFAVGATVLFIIQLFWQISITGDQFAGFFFLFLIFFLISLIIFHVL